MPSSGLRFGLRPEHGHKARVPSSLSIASPKAPTPGRIMRSAASSAAGSAVTLRVEAQMPQAGAQAEQVAHAVVHNCDHQRTPFVEGISSG
jgi:hypothetical protein